MSLPPPSYNRDSYDFPVPDYSYEPRADEETLEFRQRRQLHGHVTRPTGVFTHQKDGATIVLNHQEDRTPTPVFDRRDNVEGILILDTPGSVSEITLKLTGTVETVSPSTGRTFIKVLDHTQSLYKSGDSKASQPTDCPRSLFFSCPIPNTFKHNSQEYLLPPSYYVLLGGQGQAYYAKCTYNFSVITLKVRSRRTAFLGKDKKYYGFLFEYSPRSCPLRPVIARSLLSTIKTCPEEWCQFSYELIPKSNKYNLEPLTCQFFIPSVGVFCIRESIPFHVQLLASNSGAFAKLQSASRMDNSEPFFQVHFLRQVEINNKEKKSAVHFPLREATMSPVPPVEVTISESSAQSRQGQKLDWEGEIPYGGETTLASSFNAGILAVTDFIVLELSTPHKNFFQPFTHRHPVRLVSDAWR
ncbi:hypothetical protein J3R30DRAFT_152352 [Lentinula aciculospora]|uniref:Uncharacterized protein n=1 Tax=Lentinula aciculospora TaxID=153920 RepID=A0A9W9DXB0_9AGAR|nr:hypothetical protein J3R30DRAFT_152352 [Lentinula aciculospora]